MLFSRVRSAPAEIGRARIVHHDLAREVARNARGEEIIAVELPMRVVGGEQQELVRTQMIDHAADDVGGIRSVERLDGQAEMVAENIPRRALEPGNLAAQAAPEFGAAAPTGGA